MKLDEITVGVINYNGMETLPATLRALQVLHHPVHEIMVVDNNSTDGSREWLQKSYPQVRCIALDANEGAPAARNVVLQQATTEYVFVLDNDISVEPDVLDCLVRVMQTVPRAGVCHPELRDENDPEVHHYNGGYIHYLGALIARDLPDRTRSLPPYEKFDAISGAALLIHRQQALAIGGFDTAYFFNWDDGDFTARMTLAGYTCLNIPTAIVHHRSKPRGTSKVFYQVRNRWYFMLKLYNFRTLFLIAPMLCLFELLQAAFLLKKGAFLDYCRANLAVVRDLPAILAKRKVVQKLKKVRDREWLHSGQIYIPPQLNRHSAMLARLQKGFYGLCNVYWRVVKPLC